MNWQDIEQAISHSSVKAFTLDERHNIGGGCINSAMRISGSGREYFLKFNDANLLDMFEAEADGLRDLASADAVRVPIPVCTGVTDNQSYIVMEFLPMSGGGRGVMARFGEELALMHRYTQDQFGWHRDNTIGSTPQVNDWQNDWLTFFRDHRLGYQLDLAGRRGIGYRTVQKGEKLQGSLADFFSGYKPVASILHGDLWSGNYGITASGDPVIFDPATYFGDREADLAMTELFGGFGNEFYAAYNDTWPVDAGYSVRKTLYNLYHILNHYNLFGGGYGSQADGMIERLLAEVA